MILNWDKKQMKTYCQNLRNKKSLTEFDFLAFEFYDTYLNDKYSFDYNTKDQYEDELTLQEEDRIVSINEIKDKCKEFKELFIGNYSTHIYKSFITLLKYAGRTNYGLKQEISVQQKEITDEEFIDQSYQMFGSISSKFNPFLNYIYENKLVKIKKDIDILDEPSFCLPDLHNKVGYVYLNEKEKDSTLESAYNHELMHSLTCNINPKMYQSDSPIFENFDLINEAHAIYMLFYTNQQLYEKSKDINYIISNYNYINYLQRIIFYFNVIYLISDLKEINQNNIEDVLYNRLNLVIEDFNGFATTIVDESIEKYLKYLFSGLVALHLLEQDFAKSRELFTDSIFNDYKSVNRFLRKIEFNLKDDYYACRLFNRVNCRIEAFIRKR